MAFHLINQISNDSWQHNYDWHRQESSQSTNHTQHMDPDSSAYQLTQTSHNAYWTTQSDQIYQQSIFHPNQSISPNQSIVDDVSPQDIVHWRALPDQSQIYSQSPVMKQEGDMGKVGKRASINQRSANHGSQKRSKGGTQKRKEPHSSSNSHQIVTKQRRLAANARERRRMNSLNTAFDNLRDVLPSVETGRKLSKFDTLQMAQTYIEALMEILGKSKEDISENEDK